MIIILIIPNINKPSQRQKHFLTYWYFILINTKYCKLINTKILVKPEGRVRIMFGTKYSRMNQVKLWKTVFKKFEEYGMLSRPICMLVSST